MVDFHGSAMNCGDTIEAPVLNPFKDTSTIKVMTCEPSAGLVDCQIYDNRIDFYMELARLESRSKFKFFSRNTGRMGVNYAREAMSSLAIENGMDYVLMIDDDQIVPRDLFERLFKTMKETGAHIISPMVTQRLHPFNPVMWRQSYSDENGKKAVYNEFISEYEPNSIVEADAVGFGCVLIDVAMLKKIDMPRFFSNNSFGEDLWLCMRAKGQAGAKIVVDTSIKVGHLAPPEAKGEWDWAKATNRTEKFKHLYKENK